MQVILMEKVVNLGSLGDVVKVKDGFARNYLIPQGKARRATAANLKEFEGRRTELEKKAGEGLASAQERAAKLEGMKVDIVQKAGPDGRLFGSVRTSDIAEALTKAGIETKKAEGACPPARSSTSVNSRSSCTCTPTWKPTSSCTWRRSSRNWAPAYAGATKKPPSGGFFYFFGLTGGAPGFIPGLVATPTAFGRIAAT